MKDELIQDIMHFFELHEAELPVSFSGDSERRRYAERLLDAIRFYSLEKMQSDLSGEEGSKDFELRLKEAIQYDNRKNTLEFFESIEEKNADKEEEPARRVKIISIQRSSSRIIAIAASLAILVVSGWWFWSLNQQDALYPKYFNLPAHDYLMRSSDDMEPMVREAFIYFDNEEYSDAIPLLSELFAETGNSDFKFYEAVSYMELKEFANANKLFSDLTQSHPEKMEIRWYYALSLIQSGDIELAIEQLNKVAGSDHFRSDLARDLLRDLKK